MAAIPVIVGCRRRRRWSVDIARERQHHAGGLRPRGPRQRSLRPRAPSSNSCTRVARAPSPYWRSWRARRPKGAAPAYAGAGPSDMRWFIRDYHDDDPRPWCASSTPRAPIRAACLDSEVIAALRDDQPAVVAQRDDEVEGVVVPCPGDRAWVARFAIAESGAARAWRRRSCSAPSALDDQRASCPTSSPRRSSLPTVWRTPVSRGVPRSRTFEKVVSVQPARLDLLGSPAGTCRLEAREDLAGCTARRGAHRASRGRNPRPARSGCAPRGRAAAGDHPSSVLRHGKTSFAPRYREPPLAGLFVEVLPSALLADPGGPAAALRATFDRVRRLERVLVFIDEVEEIASARGDRSPARADQRATGGGARVPPSRRAAARLRHQRPAPA